MLLACTVPSSGTVILHQEAVPTMGGAHMQTAEGEHITDEVCQKMQSYVDMKLLSEDHDTWSAYAAFSIQYTLLTSAQVIL